MTYMIIQLLGCGGIIFNQIEKSEKKMNSISRQTTNAIFGEKWTNLSFCHFIIVFFHFASLKDSIARPTIGDFFIECLQENRIFLMFTSTTRYYSVCYMRVRNHLREKVSKLLKIFFAKIE